MVLNPCLWPLFNTPLTTKNPYTRWKTVHFKIWKSGVYNHDNKESVQTMHRVYDCFPRMWSHEARTHKAYKTGQTLKGSQFV